MMISVTNETIASIPALHVVQEELRHEPLPTVFFLHGFTSAKEHNLHHAYLLAQKRIRVILPEALYHGERAAFEDEQKLQLSFWEIVLRSIEELPQMKHFVVENGWTASDVIGVTGTSMGAITMFGALKKYPWIRAGASLMGSAFYQHFAKKQIEFLEERGVTLANEIKEDTLVKLKEVDLGEEIDALNNRPLYLWHGERDNVVPFAYSQQLNEQLQQRNYEQVVFTSDPRGDHKVSRAALLESVDWMARQLMPTTTSVRT
ncbi:esterase [Halalkalibacterium halodurans]|nr:esterase [Halalkalibacterium halodurans]